MTLIWPSPATLTGHQIMMRIPTDQLIQTVPDITRIPSNRMAAAMGIITIYLRIIDTGVFFQRCGILSRTFLEDK